MNDSDYEEIKERLGKVERQNHYMKMVGAVIILLLAVLLIAAVAKKKPKVFEEIPSWWHALQKQQSQ